MHRTHEIADNSVVMTEASWKRLIDKIRESNVVPIIGSRLLVGADGQTSLQAQVAARLLSDCGKDIGDEPLSPFRELNDAVSRLKGSVDPQDLYDCVHEAICAVTDRGRLCRAGADPAAGANRRLPPLRDADLGRSARPLPARALRADRDRALAESADQRGKGPAQGLEDTTRRGVPAVPVRQVALRADVRDPRRGRPRVRPQPDCPRQPGHRRSSASCSSATSC